MALTKQQYESLKEAFDAAFDAGRDQYRCGTAAERGDYYRFTSALFAAAPDLEYPTPSLKESFAAIWNPKGCFRAETAEERLAYQTFSADLTNAAPEIMRFNAPKA